MSLFSRWFGSRELPDEIRHDVQRWRAQPEVDERIPMAEVGFIVVDIETTGLDVRHDRVLAIGACRIERLRLLARPTFHRLIHNLEGSSRENILIHEIGPEEQAAGQPEQRVLSEFLSFAGRNPILGFHVGFDHAVLDRALRRALGVKLVNPALDLAVLAATLCPQARLVNAPLDAWLDFYGLHAHRRHSAIYDAWVTAELALVLLAQARSHGIGTLAQLRALAGRPSGGIGSA